MQVKHIKVHYHLFQNYKVEKPGAEPDLTVWVWIDLLFSQKHVQLCVAQKNTLIVPPPPLHIP